MRNITLAQINPIVGNVEANLKSVRGAIENAPKDSLLVFPEMALTGYPLEDLVFSKDLQHESEAGLMVIATMLAELKLDSKVLIGYLQSPLAAGGKPRNGAALVSAQGVEEVSSKIALPTYGVFDERRLFAPGEQIMSFTWDEQKIAVLICEDMWRLDKEAMVQARGLNPDVLISINGSPFEDGKLHRRVKIVKEALDFTKASLGVYVNMAGAQDDLVFDGGSFIYSTRQHGRILQLPFFEAVNENLGGFTFDGFTSLGEYTHPREEMLYNAAVLGLRDYVLKSGFKKVVVGVSGGIDSALVTAMAADALGGENVLGISMPSMYSSNGSLTDADKLMTNVGGEYRVVEIAPMMKAFHAGVELTGIAAENLQARIRGTILMGVSNQEGCLVLTPGNKSELAMGYSTLYGDSVGCYAPLKDLYKVDVFALAEWRNREEEFIPASSITKPPSAELAPGQMDQDSLPPYDLLDEFLYFAIEDRWSRTQLAGAYGHDFTEKILASIRRAEWKRRQYPIGPKLSKMSFGRERFIPIVNQTPAR